MRIARTNRRHTISRTRKVTRAMGTRPSFTLFREAESVVNDTYQSPRKVCLLANTYTQLTTHDHDNFVNFSPMLKTLKMNNYDFVRLIYIYLENERRLNKHQLLEFTQKQFNIKYDNNAIHELIRSNNGKIDILDGLKIGLHIGHDDVVCIDTKSFGDTNGDGIIYRILLPHLYKEIREHSFGHNSICNYSTRKYINDIFYNTTYNYSTRKRINDIFYKTIPLESDSVDLMCGFIIEDFISNSRFYNNDTEVEIGNLMDKYAISSSDLFYSMYHGVDPRRDVPYQCDDNYVLTREKAIKVLASNNYYIKYHNCRPIKQNFRYRSGEPQNINIREYENRSYEGAFYVAILRCMLDALKN